MSKKFKLIGNCKQEDILVKIREEQDHWKRLKWQIIYSLQADLRYAEIIAKQFGVSIQFVENAVKEYNRKGAESFNDIGRGKHRKRCCLNSQREKEILSAYTQASSNGEITTVKTIKEGVESEINKTVAYSTITRMLFRNGWRKVKARPVHPNSDKEKQLTFKKTLPQWCKQL